MKRKYQDLTIEFPLEVDTILDLGLECGYSEHPSFWFKAVIPEEKAQEYIGKITEHTTIKVTYTNKKKNAERVMFRGFAANAKVRFDGTYHVLYVEALAHTAKMDIKKKSRSFFKQGVTYHEIIQAVAKDYPGAVVAENIPSSRKTDMPVLQYEETDWEFLKRISAMFEAVVTPDCTKEKIYLTMGIPKREDKAKDIKKYEQTTIRDLGECYKDYYEEMTAFSVLTLIEKEKKKKAEEARKKKIKGKLKAAKAEEMGKIGKSEIKDMQASDFLAKEEEKEKEKLANDTLKEIEAMIDSGELDISSLGYSKKDLKKLICNTMTGMEQEDTEKEKKPDAVEKEKGKKAQESSFQELNYTTVAVKTKRYIPLGKRILIDDSELAVTHIEAYTEKEEIFYEYILRWPDAITARYEDNPALAGVSLTGTIKECKGNMVSLALEIDEDDGYEDGKKDYFFTYAIESKDYYCMPVAGAKVHLYFQTGKEWDAIAVHSLRGIEAGGERENKISNPDNRSLSNTTGCSIDLTPTGISMTPDDGNTVELKLGKDGSIDMRAKDFTLTGKNIDLGKGTSPEGEETIARTFSITTADSILLNRCQPNADGEIVPIEDHLAGMFGDVQLYTPGSIFHRTTGAFQPPAISYDETELRKQEEAQAEENHQQLTNALVARRKEAKAKFAMGMLMAGVGAALMVCTGGMIAPLVGAAMIIFAEAEMQEAQSLKSLAESGDFETPPANALKEMIGEPAYTLIKTGLCITGSIMIAGPGVLVMGAMNTGIELVTDALSGNLKSWQHYCDTFSKGCLIGAIMGPITGKLNKLGEAANAMQKAGTIGSKTAFAIKFGAGYVSQVTASILNDMANGTMSWGSIGENAFREFISLGVASLPSNINCNTRALLNGIADGGAEAVIQLIRDGKVDWKQVLQTAGMSALINRATSCDPVDCAKGNFIVYREDYSCEDLYGSFGIHRRYSSILEYTGAMGKGWMLEYETFLMTVDEVSEESDLTYGLQVMMPDTHVERFERRKGEWVNLRGNTKEVTLTEDRISRQYSLESCQGGNYVQYIYDSRGRLTQISEDACSSRATRITYIGETGQIEKIISPGGRILKFGYERDKIVTIQDETGRKLRYEYEGSYLISASYPTGGKQTYIYDGEGRIETMDGWDGRDFLTNQYDKKGRVTSQTYPDGNRCTIEYDDRHNETWFTFSDTGRWEHYYSDGMEHVVRTERGTGEKAKEKIKELQKEHGNRTIEAMEAIKAMEGITVEEAYYDERGNKLWETDKNGNRQTWEYNEYGQVIKEEQADGLVTRIHYDASHRIVKTEDSSGRKTEYQYNGRNRRKEKEIQWLTEEEKAETRYSYDRYGRLLTRTDALGNTEEYSYDEGSSHNPLSYTAADGTEFSYTLDSMGRTAGITSPYGTVKLTHSDTGEIVRTEDALGNVTEKMVDAIGNVLKLIPPNAYKGNLGGEEAYRYRYDYLDRLIETRDPYGTIHRTIVDMDGNIIKEIHPESYDAKTDDGEGITYTYDGDQNRITRTRPDGGTTRYKYDKNGNLIKVIQPEQYNKETDDGEGMEYRYDAGNRLQEVIAPNGTAIRRFLYDTAGRLTEERDANGNAALYRYNYAGWLMEKREPVEEKEGQLLYRVTKYEYDRAGNKTVEKRGREAVKKEQNPLEWLSLRFQYDKRNRLVRVEDSLGAAMEYTYDCLNNKTSEKARINENTYQYTRYEYDAAGRLVKAIQSADREDLGMEPNRYAKKEFLTTAYEYDKNGNVTRIVTPEGYEIKREYDLLDRITRETHVDRTSGIERSTEYTYDKAGNLITETDSRGSIQRTYDLLDQMIKETDREGNTTRYHYNKNGNLIKAIDPDNYNEATDGGEGYTFTYDSMGRLESVKNALGFLEEQNEYDANGNLIRKKDALGILAEYTYDIAGRQKTITMGGATARAGEAGKQQLSQSYTYDARGNITGITDGEGNQTRYDLDAWGRITAIHKPDGSRENYTYDHAGNVTAATDGKGNTIEYHYNSMNRLKEIVDQNGEKETYTYDSQGRMAGYTNRNRVHTTFGYTIDNQLRYKKAEQLKKAEEHTIRNRKVEPIKQENRYQYNQLGQLTEASGGGVVYHYTYTPNGNIADKLVNGRKALSYTYTSSGRVAGITDKTGKKVTYQYNRAGKVESVKDNGKPVAEYSYHEDGSLQKVRFANGIETEYTYDADKNYRSITTKTAEGEILLDYTYQYDRNGNRTQKTGAEHVRKHNGNDSSVGTTSYLYDSLQRLQEVSYPTGMVEQYQYDQAGNRALKKYGTAENFKTGSYLEEYYRYDNRNRMVERTNPQTVTYYQYDKQGNTVSELTKRFLKPETTKTQQSDGRTLVSNSLAKTELEQYKTYEYNVFNQISKVTVEEYLESDKESHVQENFYDAENLRYGIEEDRERTNFVTNGWSVFTELDAEWKPKKRLIRGYGIVASEECGHEVEESITTEPPVLDQYHFYHQNEHGDTEYITGRDGKVKNAYTYDAFGTITNSSELIKNRYTYNGEQYDQISQQYYLRARNYNPLIGRFTQEDVYRGDGLNLYAYCGNNPVMYVDPSGYGSVTYTDREIVIDGQNVGSANYKTGEYLDITINRQYLPDSTATGATVDENTLKQVQKDFNQSDAKLRGKNIENTIANANSNDYLQIGNGYNEKFPIIDLANEDSVSSIKSLNQYCKSYKTNDQVDVDKVADRIMEYYDAIDDINISINDDYDIDKELLVTLKGKDTGLKSQIEAEVNHRIEEKYNQDNAGSSENKKTKCKIV